MTDQRPRDAAWVPARTLVDVGSDRRLPPEVVQRVADYLARGHRDLLLRIQRGPEDVHTVQAPIWGGGLVGILRTFRKLLMQVARIQSVARRMSVLIVTAATEEWQMQLLVRKRHLRVFNGNGERIATLTARNSVRGEETVRRLLLRLPEDNFDLLVTYMNGSEREILGRLRYAD